MKTWIITDTHLGHKKMVEYEGRPENHSEIILQNLRKYVKSGDTLIHLGDICIGNDEAWHFDIAGYLPNNVFRVLVVGNHDKKSYSWYKNHGWNVVCDSMSIKHNGTMVLLTHRPVQKSRCVYFDYGGPVKNLHGHCHGNSHRDSEIPAGSYDPLFNYDCALETHDYKPLNLDNLLK